MKKQFTLVLVGLGLVSGAALAAHADETPMPVSNDINMTAPDQAGMWSFGGTVVLLQPTNKAFHYADVNDYAIQSATSFSSDTEHQEVDQAYKWWFGADITYHYPGNGRDVMLAYEGLHGTETDHSGIDPTIDTLTNGTDLYSPFSGDPYADAKGKTETDYDAVDLVFGQKLDVGERIRIHPFMGVRYAHIDLQDTADYAGGYTYTNIVPYIFTGNSEDVDTESEFNGVGPRFGSDAQINLGQGFSIRGRLGLSALIGTQEIKYRDTITQPDGTVTVSSDHYDDDTTRVIPEIDARLGLNYTHNCNSSIALGFEAGWQVTNYFNVVQSNSFDDDYRENADFGMQGPYARVQLDIA